MTILCVIELADKARLSRDPTKEEKDVNFLLDMYRSAQHVLKEQAEQEKVTQKSKNNLQFMTEEMKMLQRKTTQEPMFDKVSFSSVRIYILPLVPL